MQLSIIREDREKWGGTRPYPSRSYCQFTLALSFEYNRFPAWKEKEILHQKYVIEGLSCKEIADQFGTARSTILKYLKLNSIEIRGTGTNQKRKRGVAFGKKVVSGKVVNNENEALIIEKVKRLRDQELSYRKIAEVLNIMEYSTKTRKGVWSGKSVWQILNP